MSYTEELPKIWLGRIQKYWEAIIPTDYPVSSSTFSTSYDSQEVKDAVNDFEKKLGTEESVVTTLLPAGTVASNYIGTFEVKAVPGELTLLSPNKVSSDKVLAMHYVDGEWVKIDNIQVKNSYVWGTLDSFSPIAMVEYLKDIHEEDTIEGLPTGCKYIVCEGNAVNITEKDGVITLTAATGTTMTLTEKVHIIGGSIDGTAVDKTSVTVVGVNTSDIVYKIIGGSFYYSEDTNPVPTTVNEVNVTVVDSVGVHGITGSYGMVRTNAVNTTISNSTLSWVGCGESWITVKKKDCNTPDCSFASLAWVKKSTLILNNVVCELPYGSGNSGYLYVDANEMYVNGGTIGYLINGGSNGCTNTSTVVAKDAAITIAQSTNRGNVVSAVSTFTNCQVEKLFVGGDATDSTVTGTTESIKIDINNGADDSYTILPGTQAGITLTAEIAAAIVNSVKVSRSANVTIDDTTKAILGTKYVVK